MKNKYMLFAGWKNNNCAASTNFWKAYPTLRGAIREAKKLQKSHDWWEVCSMGKGTRGGPICEAYWVYTFQTPYIPS